ncbi:GDSL-type esterase/lipase family protein [Lyngbya aestuarii]|uniref:GDSL-type esterase/lipase family protein n=1 Tax=Lyngbya aestuarii TaxID=118322 RepID=UPI00403D8B22
MTYIWDEATWLQVAMAETAQAIGAGGENNFAVANELYDPITLINYGNPLLTETEDVFSNPKQAESAEILTTEGTPNQETTPLLENNYETVAPITPPDINNIDPIFWETEEILPNPNPIESTPTPASEEEISQIMTPEAIPTAETPLILEETYEAVDPITPLKSSLPVLIEAEDMILSNYQVEATPGLASGDQVIKILGDQGTQGVAITQFTGNSDTYKVIVNYFDENDGKSAVAVKIAGNESAFTLDEDLGHSSLSNQNRVQQTIFAELKVNTGDFIQISAISNGNEFARIDSLQFLPVGDGTSLTLAFEDADDTLWGDGQNNAINGSQENEIFNGGAGDDTIKAAAGDDLIIAGAGNNTFNGGKGIDTVSYAQATGGIIADLSAGVVTRTFAPSSDIPLKIMPLGDSVTYGVINSRDSTLPLNTESGGYRKLLWDKFVATGVSSAIDFVGSLNNGPNAIDGDHEGHRGFTIEQIANDIDLNQKLASYQPDIVLLMAGTNNAKFGDAEAADENLSALIDQITTELPNTHLLVSSIPPIEDSLTKNENAIAFNQYLPDTVSDKIAQGKKVTFVDNFRSLTTADIYDGMHPSAEGYAKIADNWYSWLSSSQDSLSNLENLIGTAYDDQLTGNAGVNIIKGGAGDDIIAGGGADDRLEGNAGKDIFVLAPTTGTDMILDFEVGTDLLGLSGGLTLENLAVFQGDGSSQNDSLIQVIDSNEILALLKDVPASLITPDSFMVV